VRQEVEGVEVLAFFIFRVKWKKDQIMLVSNTSRYPVASERKWLNWLEFLARCFEK